MIPSNDKVEAMKEKVEADMEAKLGRLAAIVNGVKTVLTHKWAREFYRFLPFIGIAGFILVPDASAHILMFGLGIILFATLVAHIVRRVLFPYFDLAKLIDGIEDDPKASAAVICATVFLVTSIINAFVVLLH